MSRKTKVPDPVYAYRVTFHQWDEVEVKRYQITNSNAIDVTYINEFSVEFTTAKKGGAYRWFKTKKRADAFAIEKLQERIDFYLGTINRFKRQMKKIKSESKSK